MGSLWTNHRYLRLWLANLVSSLGSKVTAAAIPLTAAITLQATPAQMAALVVAGQLPNAIFGLLAGSWIDRGSHRRYLAGADLGQALLLAVIPAASLLGMLNLPILLAVTFLCGVLSLFTAVASVAVLPSVVRPDQLVEANAKLAMAGAAVSLVGPGFAGALIQFVTAPKAIVVDVLSFLGSAFSMREIGRTDGRSPARSIVRDVRDGLHELIATPILRALTVSSAVFAIGLAINSTILMLFLTRRLDLGPGMIGIYLAVGGVGALIGSFTAQRAGQCFGAGRSIIGGTLIEAIAAFGIPLSLLMPHPVPLLLGGQLVNGFGMSIYSVNHISLRQQIVDPRYLGRITAGRRFITFALAPVGAALGAWLGEVFGLATAMLAAGVLLLMGTSVMWFSPVRATP